MLSKVKSFKVLCVCLIEITNSFFNFSFNKSSEKELNVGPAVHI